LFSKLERHMRGFHVHLCINVCRVLTAGPINGGKVRIVVAAKPAT